MGMFFWIEKTKGEKCPYCQSKLVDDFQSKDSNNHDVWGECCYKHKMEIKNTERGCITLNKKEVNNFYTRCENCNKKIEYYYYKNKILLANKEIE